MFTSITHHGMYVLDYDEALDFYVGKLRMEVSADVDLGVMRWLTVCVPGDDRHILLELPEGPGTSEQSAQQIRELLSKGAMGLGFILTTDDCRATAADLAAKGVEITDEPTEQPYGIDCGIRDPFGNHLRITQPAEQLGEFTPDVLERYATEVPEAR
ncbi:VOC family protein [Aeromicrobium phragmitis]|uniref:VOC family protein n=1 Tax=Aeromicrobium phragmitis TaxID=2478914 RepID=A0A3L8PPS5_9ACTN|nr:VOC family protein [Aeromicrobium phragmitis]RLV57330.1 VOC family protein [Aeromicrobium phragmitis]